jgi:hypothetical protein
MNKQKKITLVMDNLTTHNADHFMRSFRQKKQRLYWKVRVRAHSEAWQLVEYS